MGAADLSFLRPRSRRDFMRADQQGFLLVYVNSFNEWHEGDAFEPMLDAAGIPTRQQVFGYHNPARGDYRLTVLRDLLRQIMTTQVSFPTGKSA